MPGEASAGQPVVTLATLQWEPYVGEQLENQGFTSEIVRAAFAATGYQVEIRFTSWARALEGAERGEVDGAYPAYHSAERERKFAMSEPFASGPLVLAARHDSSPAYDSVRDLAGLRIGVVKGYVNTEAIDQADDLDKVVAYDDAVNLRRLLIGRLDLIVIDRETARFILDEVFPGRRAEVVFLQPPLEKRELFVVFSRATENGREMRDAFNRGLGRIRKSGELQSILSRHGMTGAKP